jgi:hypothetical protein
MRTMRLAETMLPSSPASERQTWMPLLPQSAMSLCAISRPIASRLRMAACMTCVTLQSATLPEHAMSEMPLAGQRQMAQAHALAIADRDEAVGASVVERLIGAVENETFEQDAIGMVGGDEGAAAGKLQRGRARGADETRSGAQLEGADAIAPGGQLERRPAAGGVVERGLQRRALVDRTAGGEVECGARTRARARLGGSRAGGGHTGSQASRDAGGEYVSAIERHRYEPRESMPGEKQV